MTEGGVGKPMHNLDDKVVTENGIEKIISADPM